MTEPQRYRAFWVPGLNDDQVDPDEALAVALEWLRIVPCTGVRLIVMNAVKMAENRPILGKAAPRYRFVSPRSSKPPGFYGGGNAILAIWPTKDTLEFAEGGARNGALCVAPGRLYDARPWMSQSGAKNLWNPEASPEPLTELPARFQEVLDYLVTLDGNNDFLTTKDETIRSLRAVMAAGHRPDPEDVENYLLTKQGVRSPKGARRLREWYERLLSGRRLRDYRGRSI